MSNIPLPEDGPDRGDEPMPKKTRAAWSTPWMLMGAIVNLSTPAPHRYGSPKGK